MKFGWTIILIMGQIFRPWLKKQSFSKSLGNQEVYFLAIFSNSDSWLPVGVTGPAGHGESKLLGIYPETHSGFGIFEEKLLHYTMCAPTVRT